MIASRQSTSESSASATVNKLSATAASTAACDVATWLATNDGSQPFKSDDAKYVTVHPKSSPLAPLLRRMAVAVPLPPFPPPIPPLPRCT